MKMIGKPVFIIDERVSWNNLSVANVFHPMRLGRICEAYNLELEELVELY
jgi:hypothetical protein